MDFDFALDGQDSRTLSQEGIWFTPQAMRGGPLGKADDPVRLKLLGPDSDTYRRLIRQQARRRMRDLATGAATDDEATFAREEADTLEILAACTVDWSGVFTSKGEAIPVSKEAAGALYRGFPHIRDQVDMWISNRGNFIKTP